MHPVNTLTPGHALKLVRQAKRLIKQLKQAFGRGYSYLDVYHQATKRLRRRERLFERVVRRENEARALSINEG